MLIQYVGCSLIIISVCLVDVIGEARVCTECNISLLLFLVLPFINLRSGIRAYVCACAGVNYCHVLF